MKIITSSNKNFLIGMSGKAREIKEYVNKSKNK